MCACMVLLCTAHQFQKNFRHLFLLGMETFFNSVSILISGNENLATSLRLASVLHAVGHFHHYLTMVCN